MKSLELDGDVTVVGEESVRAYASFRRQKTVGFGVTGTEFKKMTPPSEIGSKTDLPK